MVLSFFIFFFVQLDSLVHLWVYLRPKVSLFRLSSYLLVRPHAFRLCSAPKISFFPYWCALSNAQSEVVGLLDARADRRAFRSSSNFSTSPETTWRSLMTRRCSSPMRVSFNCRASFKPAHEFYRAWPAPTPHVFYLFLCKWRNGWPSRSMLNFKCIQSALLSINLVILGRFWHWHRYPEYNECAGRQHAILPSYFPNSNNSLKTCFESNFRTSGRYWSLSTSLFSLA